MGYCFLNELEDSEQYFNHDTNNKYILSLDIMNSSNVKTSNGNKKGLIEIGCNDEHRRYFKFNNNSKKLKSIKYKIYQQSTDTKFNGTISEFNSSNVHSFTQSITFPIDESNVKDYSVIVKLYFDDYSTQELHEIFYTRQLLDKLFPSSIQGKNETHTHQPFVDFPSFPTPFSTSSIPFPTPFPTSFSSPFPDSSFSSPFPDSSFSSPFPDSSFSSPFPDSSFPTPFSPSLIPFPDSFFPSTGFPTTDSTTSDSTTSGSPTSDSTTSDSTTSGSPTPPNEPCAFIQIDDYEMMNYSF